MTEPADSDSVEKQAQRHGVSIRDAVVFLVDWRRPMLTNTCPITDGSDVTAPMLSVVLRSISGIMKSKIIARSTDLIGLVAFGTGGSGDRDSWPRMRAIRPLEPLNAAGILKLDGIAAHAERLAADEYALDANLEKMESEGKEVCFGDDSPVQFDKALWAAKHQFAATIKAERTGVLYRRKVIVLTNDEDPSGGSTGSRRLAVTQAKDLFDLGAAIDVTLLSGNPVAASMASEDIDGGASTFFEDVIAGGDEEHMHALRSRVTRNVTSLEDLTEKIQHRQRTKRALARTTLQLGPDYKFGVALYTLVQRTKRPGKVELFADTNKPVKKITTATCESVGKTLRPADIRYMYRLTCLRQVRPKKVTNDPKTAAAARAAAIANSGGPVLFGFTANELTEISDIGVRGIVLYGFKNRASFRQEHILRAPSFVYPDEGAYLGSKNLFTQLLQSMIKKNLIAIVMVNLRRGRSMPRFAALVPQEEENDEDGMQLAPPGFHLYALPFKNDVRTAWRAEMTKNDPEPPEKVENMLEEDVAAAAAVAAETPPVGTEEARRMISKLTIKRYHPRNFANPDMQRFYAGLQAAAGVDGENKDEEFAIHPKEDMMQERAGDALKKFKAVTMGNGLMEWRRLNGLG